MNHDEPQVPETFYAKKEHLRNQECLKVLFETQLVVYLMLFYKLFVFALQNSLMASSCKITDFSKLLLKIALLSWKPTVFYNVYAYVTFDTFDINIYITSSPCGQCFRQNTHLQICKNIKFVESGQKHFLRAIGQNKFWSLLMSLYTWIYICLCIDIYIHTINE